MFDFRGAITDIEKSGLGRNRELEETFKKKKGDLGTFLRMKTEKCSISAGASDSGFVEIGLRGGSVFLLKSIGIVFSYGEGKLYGYNYLPSKTGKRESVLVSNLDDAESRILMELKRLNAEWESLSQAMEKGCDIALFDGSLVPLPSAVPSRGSGIFAEYEKVMKSIESARGLALRKKTMLAGVIKDSRSSRLCEKMGIRSNDSVLIENVLEEGEATPPMNYSDERKDVLFSYLKTGRNTVFRIEWFSDYLENPLQEIYSLCNISAYRYPPPLVEADLRARIRKGEFESMEKSIKSSFPNLVRARDRRPFR